MIYELRYKDRVQIIYVNTMRLDQRSDGGMEEHMERNREQRYHMGTEWRLKESMWNNEDVM